MSEQIEEIYDRLLAAEKLKTGTKYERLTALVFQVLDRAALIVHDVTLRAEGKEAAHQIDVLAEDRHGASRRVLIEARDRKDPVDLAQVRNFFGVVHQLRPDTAWIVSVTGFTEDAKRFARDEGIRLAELRPATEEEDDRLKAIHVRMLVKAMGIPTITCWLAANDEERERLSKLLKDRWGEEYPVDATREYFYDEAGQPVATLHEVLDPVFQGLELELGENEGTYEFDAVMRLDLLGVRAAVRGFTYSVELAQGVHEFTAGDPASIAELIIRSVDGAVDEPIDRVIYDTDLSGLMLDSERRVVPRR